MAEARARIIVQAKDEMSAEFQHIFERVVASYNRTLTAQEALTKANQQYVTWLREQASAAAQATSPNAQLVKTYNDVADATDRSSGGIKIFGMNIVDVAAKLYLVEVALRRVTAALDIVYQLAELGAQVEQSDISFSRLLATLGAAPDTMDRLREAAGGLATDYDLQAKSAIVLTGTSGELGRELANNLPHLLEIARAAKVVNPAIRDVDYAYESLTTGIKRAEKRWLDNIGIIFNASDAYEQYAAQVGKSADDLTEQERALAFLYKTIEVGDTIITQAGGSVESLTDRYGRLETAGNELKQGIGILLDQALSPLIDDLTEAVGVGEDFQETMALIGLVIGRAIDSIREGSAWVDKLIFGFRTAEILEDVWGKIGIAFQSVTDQLREELPQATDTATIALQDFSSGGIKAVDKFAESVQSAFGDFNRTVVDTLISTQEQQNRLMERLEEETARFADRREAIYSKAARDREEAEASHRERMLSITERYSDRESDLLKEISKLQDLIAGKKPALTESEKIQEGIDSATESIEELGRKLSEGLIDPARVEYTKLLIEQLGAQRQMLESKYDKAILKERLATLQEELSEVQATREKELGREQQRYNKQLADITATATSAVEVLEATSQKSADKIRSQMEEISTGMADQFREAMIDAALSVTEFGSGAEAELLRLKASIHGIILGPDSISSDLGSLAEQIAATPGRIADIIEGITYTATGIRVPAAPRQHGGSVTANQPYLVGETGPEWFMPFQGGTITPPTPGGTINVTVSAGAFLGSHADAVRLGNELVPILARALRSYSTDILRMRA